MPNTQLLEDVTDLVFLEHYLTGFAAQHPDYDEAKWIEIIRKTWQKMSQAAREFRARRESQSARYAVPLILKAVA